MERTNKRYPFVADAHSKHFKCSSVLNFVCSRDDKGNVVKYHSDIHLLLREKNLEKMVGVEALRHYVDSLRTNVAPSPELSDEELFKLVEPRDVGTITDAYQYSRYIKANSDNFKARYDDLCDKYKRYQDVIKQDVTKK